MDLIARRDRAGENAMAFTVVLCREPALVDSNLHWGLGIAEEHKAGYVPYDKEGFFTSFESGQAKANELNKKMGLSEKRAFEIVASSMGAGSQR